MTRDAMLTRVIKARGFEDYAVIKFAELMTRYAISDEELMEAMVETLEAPYEYEFEEDF